MRIERQAVPKECFKPIIALLRIGIRTRDTDRHTYLLLSKTNRKVQRQINTDDQSEDLSVYRNIRRTPAPKSIYIPGKAINNSAIKTAGNYI